MESGLPWLNAITVAAVTFIAIVMLLATMSFGWSVSRAHRASVRAQLPFGEATA